MEGGFSVSQKTEKRAIVLKIEKQYNLWHKGCKKKVSIHTFYLQE